MFKRGGRLLKFIHTSDWHIGKLVHGIHMTEDQRHLLEQFVELVRKEKPDAVIIAGDLYDRSVPPVEAVELLDEVFTKIVVELNIPIIAVAGNHDSPDRIAFGNQIVKNTGLHIEGKYSKEIVKIILQDDEGPVNFYVVPYEDPTVIRDLLQDDSIKSHNDAMKKTIEHIKENMNVEERNVLIAHGYVAGIEALEQSESERQLSIGGTEVIDVNCMTAFDYVALGHLHSPQKVSKTHIRYAGSLMKYSFSEARQKKSVTIVEMTKKGQVHLNQIQLIPRRDMRVIEGKLQDLLEPDTYKNTNIEDYLMVMLTDEHAIVDPIGKLRSVYPNVLKVERSSFKRSSEVLSLSKDSTEKKKTTFELFEEFYCVVTGKEFSQEKKELLQEVLQEMGKQERGE